MKKNIIKITLSLIIVAGAIGIYMANGTSNKMKEMGRLINEAKTDTKTASAGEQKAKQDLKVTLGKMQVHQGTANGLKAVLTQEQGSHNQTRQLLIEAQNKTKELVSRQAVHTQNMDRSQALANQVPSLKSEVATYKNLGTPKDIKSKLDRLAKLEFVPKPATPPEKPKKDNDPWSGQIANHDPKYDIYIVNRGSDNGIKEGDVFTIFRQDKAIGRIQIKRTRPTLSVANYAEGFGPTYLKEKPIYQHPSQPFKIGDKLYANPTRK